MGGWATTVARRRERGWKEWLGSDSGTGKQGATVGEAPTMKLLCIAVGRGYDMRDDNMKMATIEGKKGDNSGAGKLGATIGRGNNDKAVVRDCGLRLW
ncbi:hypothetical protein B296_00013661 [Ensete ventricosum]|uniref:Uncharacterized protein n=1 Tax=Ensete ventricosum TaxID=4639 RepID=A0A427AFQ7_ENSVE|nr:hypothetical protein B296_00013661 [Ensete ventricosum]